MCMFCGFMDFFGKGKFYWFQKGYIEVIHHLEKFPTSAQSAHNLQKFDKNPDTLIAVDPKTRPPPMCHVKKKSLATCAKKKRCRYKNILRCMPLKNSPCKCIVEKITCKKEDCLLSNTTPFLQSQTDQHKAATPTRTSGLKLFVIFPELCPPWFFWWLW